MLCGEEYINPCVHFLVFGLKRDVYFCQKCYQAVHDFSIPEKRTLKDFTEDTNITEFAKLRLLGISIRDEYKIQSSSKR